MLRQSLLTVSVIAVSLLSLPPLQADEPAGVSRTVILGSNSVWLNRDVRVGDGITLPGGDVIANEVNLDGIVLNGGVEMSIARNAFINGAAGTSNVIEVKADSILLDRDARIDGDAHYNDLDQRQGSVIVGTQTTPLSLPVLTFPVFQTAVPGAQDILVDASNSPYLLAPGAYNNIAIVKGATLVLTGGVYDVRSISEASSGGPPCTTFPCVSVVFDDATDLRVLERFDTGKYSRVGPSDGASIDASDILIYVAGVNGGAGLPGDLPPAAKVGRESDLDANVYAPNGTVRIDQNSIVTGSLFGRDVQIDKGTLVVLASGFNKPPNAVDDDAAVLEAGVVGGNVLTNDTDPNPLDQLTVTVPQVSGPSYGTVALAADGTFSYTHDGSENFADAFVYEVCDDGIPIKCSTATVSITITPVNDPPTLDPIADPAAILEDAGEQIVGLTGIAQGGDAPGYDNEVLPAQFPLVVTATSDNTGLIPHPTVTYTSPDTTGSLAYTPVAGQSGTAVITVTVMDAGGTANGGIDTVQQTFTVEVTAVNDPPTIDPITDPAAIDEDAAQQTVNLSGITQGGGGETVPAPQFPLTVTATSDNPGLIPNPTVTYSSPDTTGSLAYTPVADANGSAVITVTVMDSGGTANGGADTTQTSFTVVVNPINDPPVIEDQSLVTDTQTVLVVDLTGTDVEGDNLTYSLFSPFDNPAIGSLTPFTQGPPATVTFLPAGDGSLGIGSFVYQVCDDGTPPGPECDLATVTIEVVAFNPAPTADSQSIFDSSAALSITLTGSDLPANGLDFSLVSGPLNGTLSGLPQDDVVGGAVVSYGPFNPGDPDSIVFSVCDNDVPEKCAFGFVTINSDEPLNNPPQADNQALDTAGDVNLPITLTASDPDAGDTLTFSIIAGSGPNAGVLTGVPPSVVYDPDTAGNVEDQFSFQVCDDGTPVLCDSATVKFNAPDENQNDPPTPQADSIRVDPLGTATDLFPSGTSLLGNDSDPNGDNLFVTTAPVSGPTNGTVTLQSDGTFSYTHTVAGTTSDQFVYEVCDDGTPVACATATVFVTVELSEIDVSVTIVGNGSVTSSSSSIDSAINCPGTCAATFDTSADLPVTLTPSADAGYNFAGWAGSSDCSEGILTTAADASCIATFTLAPPDGDPVTISVAFAGTGGGSVTSDVGSINCPAGSCSEVFAFGTRVQLTPVPDAGSRFDGWTGTGDCLPDGSLDGTVDATCTANFSLIPAIQHLLTVAFDGSGSGSVTSSGGKISCTSECSVLFDDGATVVLNARPGPGSSFGGYTGDCGTVSGFQAVIIMSADSTCTATFN